MSINGYDDELLHLAHDIGSRLLQAFVNTTTNLPFPRVIVEYKKN
jgi:mannosidase alpha-like ER degradation enhancer 1